MNHRYLSLEGNKSKEKINLTDLNNINSVEKNLNSENNINILKYITELEKKNTIKTKKKFNLKLLPKLQIPSSRFNQIKSYKSFDINNILTLKKDNISLNNKDNGCFITSLNLDKNSGENNKEKNYIKSRNTKSSIKDRILKTNRNKRIINDRFNLSSIIRDIKMKNSSYISKTEGNYYNDYIAYDNKNMKVILDINNILNTHLKNQEWDLRTREDKYDDFIERKKGVCVQNLMIKLMNEEREKLKNKYKKYSYNFDKQIKAVTEGEKIFEEIVIDQKKSGKLMENNYYKLKDDNRILIYLRENIKEQVRKTEYEILKKIYEIDKLRVYAKFVNYIYGYDTSSYEKSIIDDDYTKKPSDTETLIKYILENYKHLLNEENTDNINNIDPEIVLNEIRLIEDRILMNLKIRDQEYERLKKYQLNNKNILKNIENRKNELENDYNYIKKEINDIVINTKLNLDEDLFSISKDLNLFILETLSKDKHLIKKYKGNLNLFELSDLAEKSHNLILKNEMLLDSCLNLMEKYNEEDKNIFNKVINKRKEEFLREKIDQAKINIEKKQLIDKFEIQKNSDKIYFIKRKALPSMPKKKKKIAKLDPNLVRELENKELISYD